MPARFFTVAIAVVAVLAVTVFVGTLVYALYAPSSEILVPAWVSPPTASTTSGPARLQIPSLTIDAKVQKVGITKKGEMGVPSNFWDVGWYKYGPSPGQLGSAVIAAHVDNALGLPGVFKHLEDMRVGNELYIIAEDGSTLRFLVVDMQYYPYNDAPVERIFGDEGSARLNLVTCSGEWIRSKQTYSKRLVVYTKFSPLP